MVMRMAIVSALTKEGAETFQKYIDEVFVEENIIVPVTNEDLSKFGMRRKQ